jgi:glyoxylase-like metal-dependent hydrolase (beta-lactamase superfamily II)
MSQGEYVVAIGDVRRIKECPDLSYVDTGMYDTDGYGAVYLLDAERPAIIESGIGTDRSRVFDALDAVGIDREALEAIVLTHVHLDHAGGAGFLAETCPNAEVVVHERGAPHLVDPDGLVAGTKRAVGDLWAFYTDPVAVPETRIRAVAAGDVIDLGDHQLSVHPTPGHAPHHVCYADRASGAVFTGDAAGVLVPERESIEETTPPPGFGFERNLADLAVLREIEPAVALFSHFGPCSDPPAAFETYGHVLEEWVETVATKRTELGDDGAVIEYFRSRTDLDAVWGEAMARPVMAVNVRGVLAYLDRTNDEGTEQ